VSEWASVFVTVSSKFPKGTFDSCMSSLWRTNGETLHLGPNVQFYFVRLSCSGSVCISSKQPHVLRDYNETGFVYSSTLVYGVVSSQVLYQFIDRGVLQAVHSVLASTLSVRQHKFEGEFW
jgi:hypothetical protein